MIIKLPPKKRNPNENLEIEFNQLVIIGANGSGKTRFGSYIEEVYFENAHRISAQKSLTMPEFVSTKSKEVAESEFLYGGYAKDNPTYYKTRGWKSNRWGNKLNTFLLNDYTNLMVLLHTEEYAQALSYKEDGGTKPKTKLDQIQEIWEEVLPHRKLKKKAGVIETFPTGNAENFYNSSEMSDGERVIFYLIGEAVCVPSNSIIIIDEPEMHIHKSIVKHLFDLIENERSDCSFIYLTHDIDFAFTRQNARKIWTKGYENELWDFEILSDETPIPEQLYLDVLGSRKPVIFIEGDSSSIDYELYEQVYSDYTLKPLGSCEKVIQVVKSFNEQQGFHHIESFGIIDRDRRSEGDVKNLNSKNIWVLDVAEAENLLLIEDIVRAVAEHMGKDPKLVSNEVKQNIINFFALQVDRQVLIHFQEIIRTNLQKISHFQSNTINEVSEEIDRNFANIDKKEIFEDINRTFKELVANKDYNEILKVFNLKNALIPESKVCTLTGVKDKIEFRNIVITLLKRKNKTSEIISKAIKEKIVKNAT